MRSHSVRLYQWDVLVPNLSEYHLLKREIFTQGRYHFDTPNDKTVIIDIGAHVGLATLYFKRLYPDSLIVSCEPHPQSYSLLVQNLENNRLSRVQPINLAVWDRSGPLTLHADDSEAQWWSTSGIHPKAWDGTQTTSPYQTKATTLDEIVSSLDCPIDLVKIDAEGAESEILFSSHYHFSHIWRYVVEFHPQRGKDLATFVKSFPQDFEIQVFKEAKPLNPKRRYGGLVTVWAQRPSNTPPPMA